MTTMQLPKPSPFAVHWDLAPDVVFLNHGDRKSTRLNSSHT